MREILLIIYDVVDKANTSERLEKDSNPRTGKPRALCFSLQFLTLLLSVLTTEVLYDMTSCLLIVTKVSEDRVASIFRFQAVSCSGLLTL